MNSIYKALEVNNLYYRYPNRDWIIRGVDLSIERGEQVLVIGETGSGKTTLCRILSGIAIPIYGGELKGVIRVLGKNIEEYSLTELPRRIHVIGQNPYLYFTEMLVYDDLYNYALSIYGDKDKAHRALSKVVEAFSIHRLLDKYFFELSGGEAKRVLVAKALIGDPEILLFDEPLMWLDEYGVRDIIAVLHILRRLGKTVIIFEHRFLPLVDRVDRVFLLCNGKLVEIAPNLRKKFPRYREASIRTKPSSPISEGRDYVVFARSIYFSYSDKRVLNGVSITIGYGDKVFIYGANGSGKTTLLKILSGYLKPDRGFVKKHGDVIYVPQNVLLFYTEDTVEREVIELCKSRGKGKECIEDGLKRAKSYGIDPRDSPFTLSHGQMIKLALELALVSGADIILVDEPFSGISYHDRVELLNKIASSKASVIVSSSWVEPATMGIWDKKYLLENGVLYELEVVDSTSIVEIAEIYKSLYGGDLA
ncbi:MAG: ATP-binding cassette domain-containing protein [Thermoprotei archaeon]